MISLIDPIFSQVVKFNLFELVSLVVVTYITGFQLGKSKSIQKSKDFNHDHNGIIVLSKSSHIQMNSKSIQTQERFQQTLTLMKESQPQNKTKLIQNEQKQNLPTELLKQKVQLQMKKIQSTGFFEMRLESSSNTKYIRKIEKHELVTDYQLKNETLNETQLVPFQQNSVSALSEPHSLFQAVAHQDYTFKMLSPLCEKKFINMNEQWRQQVVAPWILENGKFDKFFRKSKIIGKGGFGSVYKVWSLFDEKEYAVKKLVIKGMLKMRELMNEVFIISKYNHPNIVNYYSCWIELATIDDALQFSVVLPTINESHSKQNEDNSMEYLSSNSGFTFENNSSKSFKNSKNPKRPSNKMKNEIIPFKDNSNENINLIQIYTLHIQMQLCESSLQSYIKIRKQVDPCQSFAIFQQLIQGISFLHCNSIVHRDLKPDNILLSMKMKQVKIGDFGLAALIQENNDNLYCQRAGTPLYMAPELKLNVPIDKDKLQLVDVFSLGVIYYQLLHRLNECTQHQRTERLLALQFNKVNMDLKQLKEEKKMIKLMTKTINRPSIKGIKESKQYLQLKKKYFRPQ